ncbi:PqqD family protein [Dermacoccus abyssi]|uniref:PqqD family protein n=1 Tax=Dermacoccus abyssi TaxID=322596 RepID=UPI0021A8EA9F|nr:PqqD family protein [Dermacoccus abyssi]MCT1986319.1 PqqD family protein [Dermacoccus abyssi]
MTWRIPGDVAVTYDETHERFWALRVGSREPHGLSVHGYVIWQAADGAESMEQVAHHIATQHGFDAAAVRPDVEAFVPHLLDIRLLDEVTA